jgi:hypothetical protein
VVLRSKDVPIPVVLRSKDVPIPVVLRSKDVPFYLSNEKHCIFIYFFYFFYLYQILTTFNQLKIRSGKLLERSTTGMGTSLERSTTGMVHH